MKRKVISAVLAGACALSAMSFSATAAGDKKVTATGKPLTLKASAALAVPTINVSIPGTVNTIINPYGVKITYKNEEYGDKGIASATYKIINKTTACNIGVSATGSVTVPTAAKSKTEKDKVPTIIMKDAREDGGAYKDKADGAAVKAELAKETTSKVAFAYLTVAPSDGKTYTQDEIDKAKSMLETDGALPDYKKGDVTFPDATMKYDTQEKYNEKKGPYAPTDSKDNIMILGKAVTDGEGDNAVTKYTYGEFAIAGYVNAPADEANQWGSKDKITFNLVLNIGPTGEAAPTPQG